MTVEIQRTLKNDLFIYRALVAQVPILVASGLLGEKLFSFTLIASVVLMFITQVVYSIFKGTTAFSVFSSIIMMLFSSSLIQSQLGLTEMHFHIFASMVIFLIYQKWQPVVAALITTAIYHIGFMIVQMSEVHIANMPIVIFAGLHNMGIMFIHCGFAIAEASVLIYMAHLMTKESSANIKIAAAIEKISSENDLSIRIDKPSSNAEISLNDLLKKLSFLFSDYQTIAETLISSSQQINNITNKACISVEESKYRSLGSKRPVITTLKNDFFVIRLA